MRVFLLFLLFPLSIFAQELPDNAIASHLKVKKLILLRYQDSVFTDTEHVYVFDHNWKNVDGTSLSVWPPEHDSSAVITKNKNGHTEFLNLKSPDRKCFFDTVGFLWKYDANGRLIEYISYSCEKGNFYNWCHYDAKGKLTSITCPAYGSLAFTREEYHYNEAGQLVSVITWWAADPNNQTRSPQDSRVYSIEYRYDKNGLITEALPDDPMCMQGWGVPLLERNGNDNIKVTFKYIYVY